LTATASPGSTFVGWGGACGGSGSCSVPMSTDQTATATFAAVPLTGPVQTAPPSITALTQSASVWRESGKRHIHASRRTAVGTVFSFELNEPATARLTFTQEVLGRNLRGKCVAPSPGTRHSARCSRTVAVGSLSRNAHAGITRVAFGGRLSHTRTLEPGRYTLVITATDTVGRRSRPRSISFRIVN